MGDDPERQRRTACVIATNRRASNDPLSLTVGQMLWLLCGSSPAPLRRARMYYYRRAADAANAFERKQSLLRFLATLVTEQADLSKATFSRGGATVSLPEDPDDRFRWVMDNVLRMRLLQRPDFWTAPRKRSVGAPRRLEFQSLDPVAYFTLEQGQIPTLQKQLGTAAVTPDVYQEFLNPANEPWDSTLPEVNCDEFIDDMSHESPEAENPATVVEQDAPSVANSATTTTTTTTTITTTVTTPQLQPQPQPQPQTGKRAREEVVQARRERRTIRTQIPPRPGGTLSTMVRQGEPYAIPVSTRFARFIEPLELLHWNRLVEYSTLERRVSTYEQAISSTEVVNQGACTYCTTPAAPRAVVEQLRRQENIYVRRLEQATLNQRQQVSAANGGRPVLLDVAWAKRAFQEELLRDSIILLRDNRPDMLPSTSPVLSMLDVAEGIDRATAASQVSNAIVAYVSQLASQDPDASSFSRTPETLALFFDELTETGGITGVVCARCVLSRPARQNALAANPGADVINTVNYGAILPIPAAALPGTFLPLTRSIQTTVASSSLAAGGSDVALLPFIPMRTDRNTRPTHLDDSIIVPLGRYDWGSTRLGPFSIPIGGLALARTGLTPNMAVVRVLEYHTAFVPPMVDPGVEPFMVRVSYVWPPASGGNTHNNNNGDDPSMDLAVSFDALYPILEWPEWQSFVTFRQRIQPLAPYPWVLHMHGQPLDAQRRILQTVSGQPEVDQDAINVAMVHLDRHESTASVSRTPVVDMLIAAMTSDVPPDGVVAPHLAMAFGTDTITQEQVLQTIARILQEVEVRPVSAQEVRVSASAASIDRLESRTAWGSAWRGFNANRVLSQLINDMPVTVPSLPEQAQRRLATTDVFAAVLARRDPPIVLGRTVDAYRDVDSVVASVACALSGIRIARQVGQPDYRAVAVRLFPQFCLPESVPPRREPPLENSYHAVYMLASDMLPPNVASLFTTTTNTLDAFVREKWGPAYAYHYQPMARLDDTSRVSPTAGQPQSPRPATAFFLAAPPSNRQQQLQPQRTNVAAQNVQQRAPTVPRPLGSQITQVTTPSARAWLNSWVRLMAGDDADLVPGLRQYTIRVIGEVARENPEFYQITAEAASEAQRERVLERYNPTLL